jgi:predicted deacylase
MGVLWEKFAVELGGQTMTLPVFDAGSATMGKTVLITAGMDGDEYAGIHAAIRIARYLSAIELTGRVIVCPLVNRPGYEIGTSRNPLDGRYPKHIYPGKKFGSASERIVRWLSDRYIRHAKLWIDLHGGASDERIIPFIWTYRTGILPVDSLTDSVLTAISPKHAVFQQHASWCKVIRLARSGIAYAIFESGDRGKAESDDIERHVTWVKQALDVLGIINTRMKSHSESHRNHFLQSVSSVVAPGDVGWEPVKKPGDIVENGEVLGTYRRNGTAFPVRADREGILLYAKLPLTVAQGETLAAVGSSSG